MTQKVLVIGLDGATFDLINPWVEQGYLPTFAQLMTQGAYGELRSTIPPLTCPAWFSFSTGKNPGKLGLFHFSMLKPNSYDLVTYNYQDMRSKELWDFLGEAGYRVGVINNPVTYPPRPVNGFMVSGFMAPSTRANYTYPTGLRHELDAVCDGYEIDVSNFLAMQDQAVEAECYRILEKRMRAFSHLVQNKEWDFFFLVFTGTDRINHLLLNHLYDDSPSAAGQQKEYQARMRRFYQTVDGHIGELLQSVGKDTHVFLMSDHGFGPQDRVFPINEWLIEKGYLVLNRGRIQLMKRVSSLISPILWKTYDSLKQLGFKKIAEWIPARIRNRLPLKSRLGGTGVRFQNLLTTAVDWSRTTAFAMPDTIYINTTDRPRGIVKPGAEYTKLLDHLKADLNTLTDPQTGQPLGVKVWHRDQIYHGPYVHIAPDLYVTIEGGRYSLGIHPGVNVDEKLKIANHRMNGIFVAYGPDIKRGYHLSQAEIIDVTPTILHLLDIPLPDDMDGKVLREIFRPETSAARRKTRTQTPDDRKPEDTSSWTDEEEKVIRERLESLGYL